MSSRTTAAVQAEKQANDRHITAVCVASGLITGAVAAVCWHIGYWRFAAGIVVGAAVGIASLMTIRAMVNALVAPAGAERQKRGLRRLHIAAVVRYGVIGFIIWFAMRYGTASGIGIAVGVSMPFAVLLIETLAACLIKESRCRS